MSIEIRELRMFAEMLDVPRVQREIWRFNDDTGFYPPSLLAFADNGGLVLGAYDTATGAMVGFLVGFLARHTGGQLKLYSQSMGVLPAYRQAGLARQLKSRQRDWALAQGLRLITWTYDPLEMPNARLNITRLGGLVRRYRRNIYGEQFGQLNQGLPSDRFVVEWWLDSPHVTACLAGAPETPPEAEPVTEIRGEGACRRITRYQCDATAPAVRVDVLSDLQATKACDMSLALDWRLKTREIFESYFSQGYAVTHFVTVGTGEQRENRYLLSRVDMPGRRWIGEE